MGVRIRERNGREYFTINWKQNGKRFEKGLGFAPEWNREKAEAELLKLKTPSHTAPATKVETSPPTITNRKPPRETRVMAIAETATKVATASKPATAAPCLTFAQAFERFYDHASTYKSSWRDDRARYRAHLAGSIGCLHLDQIRVATIEELKLRLKAKGLSPATQVRVLALVRVVFNHVIRLELFDGTNPVSKVRMPKVNNQRLRYLTREEAELVLDSCHSALSPAHDDVHDCALLSLYSGMRLSECLELVWNDIDLDRETITIRDSKNGSSRVTFIHPKVKEMFEWRRKGQGKVFRLHPHTVTHYFRRIISDLGLNDGIDDIRQRVVFHSLRHTFCSWQAEKGTGLQVLKELAGHKTLAMTMRYSHLSDKSLREAVNAL